MKDVLDKRPDQSGAKRSVREVHEPLLRPVDAVGKVNENVVMKKEALMITIVYVILLLLGVGTGYLLAHKDTTGNTLSPTGSTASKKVVGVQDASTFKDCATGKIEKEGSDGEGTHKLIRDGGPSQTAYLLSSVVDLDQYVGTTVKVCGQTLGAKKVSWLMDVGRLEPVN